jgi:hypothetical protein
MSPTRESNADVRDTVGVSDHHRLRDRQCAVGHNANRSILPKIRWICTSVRSYTWKVTGIQVLGVVIKSALSQHVGVRKARYDNVKRLAEFRTRVL